RKQALADSAVRPTGTIRFGLVAEVAVTLVVASLAVASISWWLKPTPIYVGVLHSQTGTMAGAENAVLRMTLAAIEDVNRHGGVNGQPVKAVIADGESDEHVFAKQAEALLTQTKVAAIFGGWTSASRKAMLPVLEQHEGLLFYPVQYEGLEASENVIYTGAAPNQQLNPALTWMVSHFGKRVLLVGSDYIFPRIEFASAKLLLHSIGAEVCDERYMRLGDGNVADLAAVVARCQPDFIVNAVNGGDNLALFSALRADDRTTPILSLSIDEMQLKQLILALGDVVTKEHYAAAGYFDSLDTPENSAFIARVEAIQGSSAASLLPISAAMKSAWDSVHLWAQAANIANTTNLAQIQVALAGMSYASATGPVSIELYNRHLWQKIYVAKAQPNGQFHVLWQSSGLVKPTPWPLGYNKSTWEAMEAGWYQKWGQQWQAP
ncbi:MAG: transporter substrate-binding protein, partial [Proteobacteria bacterium]|nr:transporter substrate-binding protein [Pseudomonadota bacterium]